MNWKIIEKEIAKERIEILFNLARKIFNFSPELANRYIQLIRKIGMKARVKIPLEYKLFICKKCNSFLVPGRNCRVRIRSEKGTKIVFTCLNCSYIKRYPATREKKLKE
ncbi:MAG: ribonuclease P [Candidatus Bathyarchaeia archaeon]|nr:ribonuclease P [Candidatus Bathyarchaeota archaeon]